MIAGLQGYDFLLAFYLLYNDIALWLIILDNFLLSFVRPIYNYWVSMVCFRPTPMFFTSFSLVCYGEALIGPIDNFGYTIKPPIPKGERMTLNCFVVQTLKSSSIDKMSHV